LALAPQILQVEDCLIIGTQRGRDFVDWWYWHRHDLLVRYSIFALSFGSWIIWRERFARPRTAEQIVGPERRERVSHQAWSGEGAR